MTCRSVAGMPPVILPEIGGCTEIAERGHRSIRSDDGAGNRARRIIVQVVHPAIDVAMMPMVMMPVMTMPVMVVATMMMGGKRRTREHRQHGCESGKPEHLASSENGKTH